MRAAPSVVRGVCVAAFFTRGRYRQFAAGQVPVHWVFHFDPRGEQSLRYRCKNVNLVEKTVKGVEDELEFLFVP